MDSGKVRDSYRIQPIWTLRPCPTGAKLNISKIIGQALVIKLCPVSWRCWLKIRIPGSLPTVIPIRSRLLKVYEQHLSPKDYGRTLRQIAISSSGRSKPALIITNDLTLPIFSEGDRLFSEGDRLFSEGDRLFSERDRPRLSQSSQDS